MSYTEGGTSGDDLQIASTYADVGFEGTVKLEEEGGGAISCYIRGYSNSCFTTDSRIYPLNVENGTIGEGKLYIIVDKYIQPSGVITIDISFTTRNRLNDNLQFTERLPQVGLDGDCIAPEHVIALDTISNHNNRIYYESDSYVLDNYNNSVRSWILGKPSEYVSSHTKIILTESREYVGDEHKQQLITNISTGERFTRFRRNYTW